MKISILCENFIAQWRPSDIDKFLGGSQECIVLLSKSLSKISEVIVYMAGKTYYNEEKYGDVIYKDYTEFTTPDILIVFDLDHIIVKHLNCKKIYISSSITLKPEGYDHYIVLTEYHTTRNNWNDSIIIPHGIDKDSLLKNHCEKENIILYSACPTRGLKNLLEDVPKINTHFPNYKIIVTYGFALAEKIFQRTGLDESLEKLIKEHDNIIFMPSVNKDEFEKLYWKARYWIHPLNNPDSELFCLNAVKAVFCNCIPVVNRIGALQNTTSTYIDYHNFVNGDTKIITDKNKVPSYTWDEVVDIFWKPLLQ